MPAVLARAAVRSIFRGWRNWPPRGWVCLGSFRRLKPVSRTFGLDRGQPIDRYYIEAFLASEVDAIQRHILEIGDNTYTMRFGADRVDVSDVLHVEPGNPNATIVGDLARGEGIADNTFDCIIFTQTLQFIYNVDAVVSVLHRILKPGGVVLATVPGISQISRYDMDRWGDFWRFTTRSAQSLFEAHFGTGAVEVKSCGNVLTACCFLQGLSLEELTTAALAYCDPDYQVIITIKATKAKIAERR
jgi:SAM-dependent methyltransferase